MLGAPVDVCLEHLAKDHGAAFFVLHRLAGLGAQLRIGVVADHLLVVLGDTEKRADHLHRHLRAEIGDEVEPVGTDQRIEALRTVVTDHRLECVDLPGREHPRQELAVDVVDRRVLENDRAGRNLDIGLDELDDRTARRAERLMVHQRLVHVGEAAQRVEVVLLVVVQRRFLTKPPERRVRIGVDADVVRVEVHVADGGFGGTGGHGVAFRRDRGGGIRHMDYNCLTNSVTSVAWVSM